MKQATNLARKIKKNVAAKENLSSDIDRQVIDLMAATLNGYQITLTDLAAHLDVSRSYLSQVASGKKQISASVLARLIDLVSKNMCLDCGDITDSDVCVRGCRSRHSPDDAKPTMPLIQIPTRCWDCGAALTVPPHLREYQGQCPDCTAAARRDDE